MRLRILADNNTLIDHYFEGEPGFSALVDTGECRVLFDTGFSEVFQRNAQKMGEDLLQLDFIALSHGHLDHTWGLVPLIRSFTRSEIEKVPYRRPVLVAHPDVFRTRRKAPLRENGSLLSEEKCREHFDLRLSRDPVWISSDLAFLGEIPRRFPTGSSPALRQILRDGVYESDQILDDSALVWKGNEGLVVITGCSHSGICNILARACEVCGEKRIVDIVGGLHLIRAQTSVLDETIRGLKEMGVTLMHPCHCTDLSAKIALGQAFTIREAGSGLMLTY